MKYFMNLFYLTAIVFITFSLNTSAAIHTISIGNNFFAPLNTTINHGDTVRWDWVGGIPHSTTADGTSPKFWDSEISSSSSMTFDVVFTAGDGFGPFPYHCSVHLGMKDTIFIACTDADGDGYCVDVDCDDTDNSINPGAAETDCDGIDQNCDGFDGGTTDADGDGFSICDGDCNDFENSINPGAQEVCNGIDDDCDGFVDDDDLSVLATTDWYPDLDGDNFGDAGSMAIQACDQPVDHVLDNSDCDDSENSINPGAFDIPNDGIDQDCDGSDATSCCIGDTGDINGDAGTLPDISDLLYLVDYMFLPPGQSPEPPCMDEANVDGLGPSLPDISDLLYLVDYMFLPPGMAPAPVVCP